MVGIFARNKGSPRTRIESTPPPPPPYESNGHHDPVFATTTTTHVVTTTTHTTTHFFSLPLWRRRCFPANPPAVGSQPMAGVSSDELGVLHSPAQHSVLLRDKELPPTPAEDTRTAMHETAQVDTGIDGTLQVRRGSDLSGPSLIRRGSPSPGESSSIALARAALGLGLPHVMPNGISASSSSSEENMITFVPPPPISQPLQSRALQSTIRRAKSFQVDSESSSEASTAIVGERMRSRGLSVGPLHLVSNEKGKEKQRESEDEAPGQTVRPAKPLSRKSSFWSRRRNDTHLAPPAIVPAVYDQSSGPSLPMLQPVSPFYVDTSIPPSPQPPPLHRRHSERTGSSSLKGEASDDPPSVPSNLPSSPGSSKSAFRRPRRPQTADSSARPRRSTIFGDIPQVVTSSPPPVPVPLSRIEEPAPVRTRAALARPRSSTNPPLLHRLSVSLFGSSTPSPSTSSSAPALGPNMFSDLATASPTSSPGSSRKSFSKPSIEIPRPRSEEESPEIYLHRLMEAVGKAEVAIVLASNPDAFHASALRAYIDQFEFAGDPLDVALRKLLMDVGLPRETQQIDRVIEAFAARYVRCNPNLFTSDDHPYILAFSLIMLHTDAFNKSNKRKMTKQDYVKNTRLPGVAQEVLDCFYDNIVFAPFIFIEDPLDVNGQRGLIPEAARRTSTLNTSSPGGHNSSSSTVLLGKNSKIDPYYLIARNLLDDLRINVHSLVPVESPYGYQGTGGPWDEEELLRVFVMASVVEVSVMENRYLSSPWFGLSTPGGPGPIFQSSLPITALPPQGETWSLKVTKVALLLRKEDTIDGGRRAMNRKWREWSVLLTGSQLLFFRDVSFVASLRAQIDPSVGRAVFPQAAAPHPDEFLTVKDAVAVYDRSYTQHRYTFRLVISDGRHFLMQAPDEKEMNEWISRINYASAFRTAGVRMRALGMSSRDIELTGIAAAASHMRDLQHRASPHQSPRIRTWCANTPEDASNSPRDFASAGGWLSTSPTSAQTTESEPVTTPIENTSRLFKATFDQVKTELATNRWRSLDGLSVTPPGRPRAYSLESTLNSPPMSPLSENGEGSRGSKRSEIIRSKLKELETSISHAQTQLDTDMRFVRNLGVLTPFQRATRDRVQLAVQGAAKRIMQVRLNLEKLMCYRDVLSDDLRADERNWQWTRKIAMRAATQKLESQRAPVLPRMTFSVYLNDTDSPLVSSPMSIPSTISASKTSSGLDSSFEESFHSALSNREWSGEASGSAKTIDSARPRASTLFDSPKASPIDGTSPRLSNGSYPFPDVSERPHASPLAPQGSTESAGRDSETTHEKFYTAPEISEEQAEDWNKTRAAKRVSLVRLPPDLRISVLFGKQGYSGSEISEGTDTTPSSPVQKPRNPFDRTESTVDTVAMLDL